MDDSIRPEDINPKWTSHKISSGGKLGFAVWWLFVIVFGVITLSFAPEVLGTRSEDNVPLYILLVLVATLLLMLAAAITHTRRWLRFGEAPVILAPFPGQLGGNVGGTLDIHLPRSADNRFDITLSCIHRYVSGSGKNRKTHEKVLWQDSRVETATAGIHGSRLGFAFRTPRDLPASEPHSSSCHKWVLDIHCTLAGPDFSRSYEIPVLPDPAADALADLGDTVAGFEGPAESDVDITGQIADYLKNFRQTGNRISWHYPAFRSPGLTLFLLALGSPFLWIGLTSAGVLFSAAGIIVLLIAAYIAGNALWVSVENGAIRSVRTLFSIPIRAHTLGKGQVVDFDKKITSSSSSGTRRSVNYTIYAINAEGHKIPVALGIKSASEADAVGAFVSNLLG